MHLNSKKQRFISSHPSWLYFSAVLQTKGGFNLLNIQSLSFLRTSVLLQWIIVDNIRLQESSVQIILNSLFVFMLFCCFIRKQFQSCKFCWSSWRPFCLPASLSVPTVILLNVACASCHLAAPEVNARWRHMANQSHVAMSPQRSLEEGLRSVGETDTGEKWAVLQRKGKREKPEETQASFFPSFTFYFSRGQFCALWGDSAPLLKTLLFES